MNFKRFVLCLALLCIFVVGSAQAAPDKPKLTRDNFVSLEWRVPSRADENRTLDYLIDKNSISLLPTQVAGGFGGFGGGFPPYSPPDVRPLSTNQFEALVRALQLADVLAIASENAEIHRPREILILTLSDTNNADQTFAVSFSDDKKPDAYRKLSDYLAELVRGKGWAADAPATPATPPQK